MADPMSSHNVTSGCDGVAILHLSREVFVAL